MKMQHAVIGALLLVLVASLAAADEAAPPPFDARNFELLPLNDLERGELARDHPELVGRLTILAKRAERLRGHRRQRKNPNDDGGRRIAQQVREIETQMAPLIEQALELCRESGVDDKLLAHLAQAPEGPHRAARYAMGLVLYVDGMPARPRALLETLLPRVEGALLALEGQKQRVRLVAEQAEIGAKRRDALLAGFDQQVRDIERRFWRLVDYVVPRAERAAIHRVLPRAYQQRESIIQHVYALPGLTASQGTRIQALLKEIEAEASPDSAAVRRLQAEARDPKTDGTRRPGIQQESKDAQYRLLGLQRFAVEQSKRILDATQWETLEAIPPRVSYQDRQATSVDVLRGIDLSPVQRERLDTMRKELSAYRNAYRERRIKAAAKGAMMAPDSPQMAKMRMDMANVQAEGNLVQRRFNGRVLLELLTPAQVTRWVVAPLPKR